MADADLADQFSAKSSIPGDLSPQEISRLTLFKWRYMLEAAGFTEREVHYLLFHKWRIARSRPSA